MKKTLYLILFSVLAVTSLSVHAQDLLITGAGLAAVNGTYQQIGTNNGKPLYEHTSGTYVIVYDCFFACEGWHIGTMTEGWMDDVYYHSEDGATSPIGANWTETFMGTLPLPTVGFAGPALTYSSLLFREVNANNGAFESVITITHNGFEGNTFTGANEEDFVATGKAVVSNLPAGLTAVISRVSATELSFSLVGNATSHTNVDDIANLTVAFQDAAFSGGVAADIYNNQKSDIEVDFMEILTVGSSGADFTSIANALNAARDFDEIHLAGETFTEFNLTVNKDVVIRGQGADQTIVQAHAAPNTAAGRVFFITSPATVVKFYDLTVRHGYLTGTHEKGAGVLVYNFATLHMYNCAVVDNKVSVTGNGNGGGIFVSSELYLNGCLIANNTNYTTSSGGMADGGGVNAGFGYIENTTFSGNANTRATGDNSRGGALILEGGTITNSTFTNNTCAGSGGGIATKYNTLTITNVIAYGNTANMGDDLYRVGGTLNATNSIIGTMAANSGNAINGTSVNVSSSNPLLQALANNGGITQTHALGAGSPAIDAGVNGVADTDQNGFYRNGNRDIGAHENNGFPTWKGGVSTDWNVAANWGSGAVPTASDDVYIMANAVRNAHVTTNTAVCNSLTIGAGATLVIDAGKALTASGSTTNNGTLLIKADASAMGSFIDNGTITGSGDFKMEQYITGTNNAGTPNGRFYYVGSAVTGATAADYIQDSGNKLWSYSEAANGYSQLTNGAAALTALQGYTVRATANGSITQSGTGFHTGNQSTSLSRTGTSNNKRGYHLVANPYPSTVSWDNATRTNLEATIWYRTNQTGTMVFDTYNAASGIGTSNNGTAVTGNIPPGQAVWMRVDADGNTGTIGFNQANRSHGTLANIFKTEAEEGTVRMVLSNGTNSDEAIVVFNQDAQDGFDDFDSRKYWTTNVPQLYMNVDEDTLVINGLTNTFSNPVVALGAKLPTTGTYLLNASSITLTGESVYLEDKALGIFQDLNTNPAYSFVSDAGNISDRFALHFGMSVTGIDNPTAMEARVYTSNQNTIHIILADKIENGMVDVLDMSGRVVRSAALNANHNTFKLNAAPGVYVVRVATANGTETHKIVLN